MRDAQIGQVRNALRRFGPPYGVDERRARELAEHLKPLMRGLSVPEN